MAGAYELPEIGAGNKAAQAWIYPVIPQVDLFTEPIWIQDHHCVNCGLRVGTDAQDMLTAMGFDPAAHGKWFDFVGTVVLQRRMPEETEDFNWRDVYEWAVLIAGEFEGVYGPSVESCFYRLGVKAADYTSGEGIVRIGAS